jgi:GLPGLI family protein
MKKIFAVFCSFILGAATINVVAQEQRIIAECTIEFSVSATHSDDTALQSSFPTSSQIVYIKGNNSRVDLISPSFKQTTFFDKTTGEAVILREFGSNKFISKLSNAEWLAANENYNKDSVFFFDETKKILDYDCKKATVKLKNGSMFTVYYTPTVVPSVKEFQYEFTDIPGFVLEYEITNQQQKTVHYTAMNLNFNPVPAKIISIPSTDGYRLLQ